MKEQFEQLTGFIEKTVQDFDDAILKSLLSSLADLMCSTSDKATSDSEDLQRKRTVFSLSFTTLRILISCQLISAGEYEYREKLAKDIETIIEDVEKVEYAWRVDDKLLLDVIDVLDLLCAEYRQVIIHSFPGKQSLFRERRSEISGDLFYMATVMARCFIEYGNADVAGEVIEQLCFMSRESNSIDRHEELLVKSLPIIVDTCPEATFRICEKDYGLFQRQYTVEAGDFLWYYAIAAYAHGDFEKANSILKDTITVRMEVFGEQSWYTAVPKCEFVIRNIKTNREPELRRFLADFVNRIEEHQYEDMDPDYAILLEGRILYILLHNEPEIDSIEQFEHYVSLFEKLCYANKKYDSPLLKVRVAKNERGAFCVRTGDYIGAESCFLEALNTDIDEDPATQVLSDVEIKSNLLLTYQIQNDFERAFSLADELINLIISNENSGLSPADEYRVFNCYISLSSFFDVEIDELDDFMNIAKEECEDIIRKGNDLGENDKEQASFIVTVVGVLLEKEWVDRDTHWVFYNALNKIKQHYSQLKFERRRITALNIILATLAYNLELPTTGFYLKESVKDLEYFEVPAVARVSAYYLNGTYYANRKEIGLAENYLDNARRELTTAWHSSVRYLNDSRLMDLLITSQLQFAGIYAVERQILSIEACYDHLLKFKFLASLSGRERNRIINAGPFDEDLMADVRQKQDQIAVLESGTMANADETALMTAREELRKLETKFAEQFPSDFNFTEIDLENVKRMMPDNTAVIEYYESVPYFGTTPFDNVEETQCIDAYLLRKTSGICYLDRVVINSGDAILRTAEELISIYQSMSGDGATVQQLSKFDKIKADLYSALIAPLQDEIKTVETIYIAPCNALTNIPFGLLGDEKNGRLQDHYRVLKIECARDFLFSSDSSSSNDKNLVMGDPEYNIRAQSKSKWNSDNNWKRSIDLVNDDIAPLPFSGIEVRRIKLKVGADCFTGIEATKTRLLAGAKYKNIHIATHGWINYEGEADALYSSCLFFAGAQNWLKNNETSPLTGNGIVTADEISRQRWSDVNLVVLSSCMSGMNDFTINKGFNGMVSALAAAGVKYVISSLWRQDDLGTAIMMEEFYRLYIKEKMPPETALIEAQAYLRNVTIGELRATGWLNIVDNRTRAIIERFQKLTDRKKPFRNEIYWGGFECYRCN